MGCHPAGEATCPASMPLDKPSVACASAALSVAVCGGRGVRQLPCGPGVPSVPGNPDVGHRCVLPSFLRRNQGAENPPRSAQRYSDAAVGTCCGPACACCAPLGVSLRPTERCCAFWGAQLGTMTAGIVAFCLIFAVNSSVHSYLVVRYSDGNKVSRHAGRTRAAHCCAPACAAFRQPILLGP